MASDNPQSQFASEMERIENAPIDDHDKKSIIEFLRAKNSNDFTIPNSGTTLALSSLATYGQCLRVLATYSENSLMNMDTNQLNGFMQSLLDGTHDAAPSGGWAANTIIQRQAALRKLFSYHDTEINPESIIITKRPATSVNDRDIFTKDDIQQMREVISNPRDRCFFELLINTGQRVRAIQTLRIRDIDVEMGVYYLNEDDGGLKGANKTGVKRPLLGAKNAVYNWLKYHPESENPDAYLITKLPEARRGVDGEVLHQTQLNRILKIIAENAGVSKPSNAHQFRHFFVTSAKRDYKMDNDTIKHLIGHSSESKVMETTYSHLTDDDHIKSAEIATGIKEHEPESPLTPPICPTCDETLPPNAKACSSCGMVFTPDAKNVMDQIDDDMLDSAMDADTEQEKDDLRSLQQLIEEHPDKIATALSESLNEE